MTGRNLVPITMIAAMIGFAAAALSIGFVPSHPAVWRAAVSLAVLGGITPMIYAVNIRVLPVFSRRPWVNERRLPIQVGLLLIGAWLVFAGRMIGSDSLIQTGSVTALASGLLFASNVVALFRQPPKSPPPPLPFPNQVEVDRIATRFTRLAGLYLQIGLLIGAVTAFWRPDFGRWDLVWAHAMLVGFMLSMAAGICYHVLSRWTGHPWRSILPMRIHLIVVTIGVPLMLFALATDATPLFLIAGPLQAAAVLLFLATIAPLVWKLPERSKPAIVAAAGFLAIGVSMGAWFAVEATAGARLRLAHAEINLMGWSGLLICGAAYYLAPRFAKKPLRWPRLANLQLALLGGGVLIGAVALVLRGQGDVHPGLILGSQVIVATGFALFALILWGTFFTKSSSRSAVTVSSIPLMKAKPALPRIPGSGAAGRGV